MNFVLKLVLFLLIIAPAVRADSVDSSEGEGLTELKKGVESWELSNGIKVVFYKRNTAPVFAGPVWVRVGGVDEKDGATGIAHFLEHMAFKGTETIGSKDFQKEKPLLEKLENLVVNSKDQNEALSSPEAATLIKELSGLIEDNELGRIYTNAGASGLNAMTSKDYTSYVVKLPSVSFELWCWMESDRILNPVFRQFYKEREVVQEERRRGYDDDPSGQLYEAFLEKAFKTHPYHFPVIGYSKDLKTLTATQMREFYDAHYVPKNLTISIVGNISVDKVKNLTEKYFGRIQERKVPQADIPVELPQTEPRSVTLTLDAKPQLIIGYHKPTAPDPADAYFSVIHSLLAEGRSSLLHKTLVEDEHLALSIDTGEVPGERYSNLFVLEVTPAPGVSTEKIVSRIQDILDSLYSAPPKDKLIEEAKKRSRLSLLKLLSSDDGLASVLGKTQSLAGDWKEIFRFFKVLDTTTAKELADVSLKYLRPSNRTVAELQSMPVPSKKKRK
jgi:predicted Zn-dependent peptidase